MTEVKFLGHKITAEGITLDQDRVKAIVDMPIPQNKKELQRFYGMV